MDALATVRSMRYGRLCCTGSARCSQLSADSSVHRVLRTSLLHVLHSRDPTGRLSDLRVGSKARLQQNHTSSLCDRHPQELASRRCHWRAFLSRIPVRLALGRRQIRSMAHAFPVRSHSSCCLHKRLTAYCSISFQMTMVILYPTVIQPLFNKLSPLAEGTLRARIERLAEHSTSL